MGKEKRVLVKNVYEGATQVCNTSSLTQKDSPQKRNKLVHR